MKRLSCSPGPRRESSYGWATSCWRAALGLAGAHGLLRPPASCCTMGTLGGHWTGSLAWRQVLRQPPPGLPRHMARLRRPAGCARPLRPPLLALEHLFAWPQAPPARLLLASPRAAGRRASCCPLPGPREERGRNKTESET